jgi:spore germination protein GerM
MGRLPSRSLLLILFGCAVFFAAGTGWFITKHSTEMPSAEPNGAAPQRKGPGLELVHLYFSDSQGRYLKAEQRMMELPQDAARRGRRLVAALLSGPQGGGSRTLPEGTRLRSFYVTKDGVAYIDLEPEMLSHHPGGVETELLSIYSLVNTLVLNVEPIRSVKLLIGGQDAATLAGHVDLRHAFKADMMWIR